MKNIIIYILTLFPFIITAQDTMVNFKIDDDAWLRRFPTHLTKEFSGINKATAKPIDYVQDYILVRDDCDKFAFIDRNNTNFDLVDANQLLKRNIAHNNQEHKIYIHTVYIGEINSVGGVSLIIEWYYFNPDKDIKYINFYLTPFNAVGDIVSCDISHEKNIKCQKTGPIIAEKHVNYDYYENVIYNSTAMCFKLFKVEIIYMDNSKYTFIKELDKIASPNLKYCCF